MSRFRFDPDQSFDVRVSADSSVTAFENDEEKVENKADFLDSLENYGRMSAPLLIVLVILVCFGIMALFSSSVTFAYMAKKGQALYFVSRQLIFCVAGLATAYGIAKFTRIRFYNNIVFSIGAYAVTTLFLILVPIMGDNINNARRWLTIGVQFQPSEIAKIASVFCLASYFSFIKKARANNRLRRENPAQDRFYEAYLLVTQPLILMGFWLGLIVMQPHLSGAIILFLLVVVTFLAARIPLRVYLTASAQLLPIALVLIIIVMMVFPSISNGKTLPEYLSGRFEHVFSRVDVRYSEDRTQLTADDLYQVTQAKYALGVGGLTGVGLGMGKQKFAYLPEIYTDYILSSIGEELGFLGTTSVVLLFVAFFLIGSQIALNATTQFAALMAWGYSFLIGIQALLNFAVAANVIPSTGISLPFFSYGGTSNFLFLVGAGFILCVSRTAQRGHKIWVDILEPERAEREAKRREKKSQNQSRERKVEAAREDKKRQSKLEQQSAERKRRKDALLAKERRERNKLSKSSQSRTKSRPQPGSSEKPFYMDDQYLSRSDRRIKAEFDILLSEDKRRD